MTTTDWILDSALVLVVLRQIRWSRIDALFLLVPIGIVSFVAYKYLNPIPTGGNDLLLISAFAALGTFLGVAGGLTTHVRRDGKRIFVRAGFTAATLWVLGMGARLAFAVWTAHSGGPTLVRFSEQHHITSVQAWVSGLILMVLCEVGTRVGTILIRAAAAKRGAGAGAGVGSGAAVAAVVAVPSVQPVPLAAATVGAQPTSATPAPAAVHASAPASASALASAATSPANAGSAAQRMSSSVSASR